MKKLKTGIILFLSIILLSSCGIGKQEKPNELDYQVSYFRYTAQHGDPFSIADLSGQVWVADFIFTSCQTVCSPMTANMARIQQKLKEEGVDAHLVSFSVDPEIDTPERLTEFAEKFNADFSNWTFLTGYKQEEIEKFAAESFKALVKKTDASDQVSHGTSFYLVDQSGIVVKSYSGTNKTPIDEIVSDIKALQQD